MANIFKIAWRNLFRYKRRTLLTASLIVLGMVLVLVFSGVGSTFTNHVIGVLIDSSVGSIQIHRQGYMSSLDNLPLDLSLKGTMNPLEGVHVLDLGLYPELASAFRPERDVGVAAHLSTFQVPVTDIQVTEQRANPFHQQGRRTPGRHPRPGRGCGARPARAAAPRRTAVHRGEPAESRASAP